MNPIITNQEGRMSDGQTDTRDLDATSGSLGRRPTGGTKFDGGKPDLSLLAYLSSDFLVAVGAALEYGAKKYAMDNYLLGMNARRLLAALGRHALAYGRGEDVDPESGVSHLGHAGACLSMLFGCARAGTLTDDRPKTKLVELERTTNELPKGA